MKRRQFIKLSALLAASGYLPRLAAKTQTSLRPLLTIPSLLEPDIKQRIVLRAAPGQCNWNNHQIATWGYNGNILGPTLKLQRGQSVQIKIINQLPEETTLHFHGLVVGGDVDGGPQAKIAAGAEREVNFTVNQPAATCWYHPHLHGRTGYQVAMGLAGMIVIEDPQSGQLQLPSQWGVDDIPLIFQDKKLNTQKGTLDYALTPMTAAVGWFGDIPLTNGQIYPQHAIPRAIIRLRLLNACNARSLDITTSDKRPLSVIASDGGLLEKPVPLTTLTLLPGERFEVLVDVRDGNAFDLQTTPVKQMAMTLAPFDQTVCLLKLMPVQIERGGEIPETLQPLPALPELNGLVHRRLHLSMDPALDKVGMQQLMQRYGHQAMAGESMGEMDGTKHSQHQAKRGHQSVHSQTLPLQSDVVDFMQGNKINGQAFQMNNIAFTVTAGHHEIWDISGEGDMMLHPFHVHGTRFRILSENGQPVAAHRQGWKDIVRVEGAVSQILVYFPYQASEQYPYMAHCHLLEHEDTGMMLNFAVKDDEYQGHGAELLE